MAATSGGFPLPHGLVHQPQPVDVPNARPPQPANAPVTGSRVLPDPPPVSTAASACPPITAIFETEVGDNGNWLLSFLSSTIDCSATDCAKAFAPAKSIVPPAFAGSSI